MIEEGINQHYQEALATWRTVETVARSYGIKKEDFISEWIENVYGEGMK
jgi:hypothetical protein